jgi:hypothetical protein
VVAVTMDLASSEFERAMVPRQAARKQGGSRLDNNGG